MQDEKRKSLSQIALNFFGIISWIALLLLIFGITLITIGKPMNEKAPPWFFSWVGLFMLLAINVAFIIVIKLLPLRITKIKIFLASLILAFSSAVLACWVALNLLSDVW